MITSVTCEFFTFFVLFSVIVINIVKIRLQVHRRILLEPLVGSSFSSVFVHSVPSAKIVCVVYMKS